MRRRRSRAAAGTGARVRRLLRGLFAFLFSNVGVVLLVLGYTAAGAYMFQLIESGGEMELVSQMDRDRDSTADYLWRNVTLVLNIFNETALKEKIAAALSAHERVTVSAARRGWGGARWTFASAFLYALTVITTIGYGHLCPRTRGGKLATVVYTLLGMPIFLLYLTNVGSLLARWCKCLYAALCLCRCCRRRTLMKLREDNAACECGSNIPSSIRVTPGSGVRNMARISSGPHSDDSSGFSYVSFDVQALTVPLTLCVAIMVGYILFGSMVFSSWERWDAVDGAYFCFVSLSSIGFGDLVPGERVMGARLEPALALCALYLTLGMALVAMCFNLMQEQVLQYYASARRAVLRAVRCAR